MPRTGAPPAFGARVGPGSRHHSRTARSQDRLRYFYLYHAAGGRGGIPSPRRRRHAGPKALQVPRAGSTGGGRGAGSAFGRSRSALSAFGDALDRGGFARGFVVAADSRAAIRLCRQVGYTEQLVHGRRRGASTPADFSPARSALSRVNVWAVQTRSMAVQCTLRRLVLPRRCALRVARLATIGRVAGWPAGLIPAPT